MNKEKEYTDSELLNTTLKTIGIPRSEVYEVIKANSEFSQKGFEFYRANYLFSTAYKIAMNNNLGFILKHDEDFYTIGYYKKEQGVTKRVKYTFSIGDLLLNKDISVIAIPLKHMVKQLKES